MPDTTTATAPDNPTLAADLEIRRLEHRVRRVSIVLRALRLREEGYRERGCVPRPLHEAIAQFAGELHADRARLTRLRRAA